MPVRRKTINISISRRILRIGTEAYPLHQITRTSTHKRRVQRGPAIKEYAEGVVGGLVVVAVVSFVAPLFVTIPVIVGALALVVFESIKLSDLLNITFHELAIETAAGSHTGLISKNPMLVAELAIKITDAINNPRAEFQMQVENIHLGDNVNVSGDHNVGKEVR